MNKPEFHPQHSDWNLIRSFIAVVEHGSLTRAAEALGLSQPTLSRQISELEQSTGSALFERAARGLKLTEEGERLVEPARFMMSAAQSLSMAMLKHDQALQGSVRITASEVVSAHVLPPILVKLARQHPEIEVELVASNQLSNLLEREADIAIRMVRPTQTALIARHIGDWGIGFYATQDYLRQSITKNNSDKKPNKLKDLAAYRWLGLDQSDRFIQGFRAAGFTIDKHFFGFRCDNHLVNWEALKAGLGIGIAPHWLARRETNLQRLEIGAEVPDLPLWLTSHRELKSNQRIRVVFDFLAKELKAIM